MTVGQELPPDHGLANRLSSAFRQSGFSSEVVVLDQHRNIQTSTFPSEVITCRLEDGRELRVLCKFESGGSNDTYGHRGGVLAEARVYRELLQPLNLSTPKYFGCCADQHGPFFLAIEFLDGCLRLCKVGGDQAIADAAKWIGVFHAVNAKRLDDDSLSWVTRHDRNYYLGWMDRAWKVASHYHLDVPWLKSLAIRFTELVDLWESQPKTIIHGEYYPKNILVQNGLIRPVDWESVAIAPGEIDLASLTENWPVDFVEQCKRAYLAARWPGAVPSSFEPSLFAARVYFQFRWLGRPVHKVTLKEAHARLEKLHSLGIEAGWIA